MRNVATRVDRPDVKDPFPGLVSETAPSKRDYAHNNQNNPDNSFHGASNGPRLRAADRQFHIGRIARANFKLSAF